MAKAEELKRLDEFVALLDDVQGMLPTWTDLPYDLFAASAKVREGLYEWAVKKRAATAEGTPARGPEPTPPPRGPGNAPERKPDKGWVWPGLEPLAPAAESPHDPKAGTVSNPDV